MSDAFFSKPRPFSKRKRDDGATASRPSTRHGTSARGAALSRGGKERTNGRKGAAGAGANGSRNKGKRRAEEDDEELDADGGDFDSDDVGSDDAEGAEDGTDEDDNLETPAQKRLRLSQMYLKSLEKDKEGVLRFPRSVRSIVELTRFAPQRSTALTRQTWIGTLLQSGCSRMSCVSFRRHPRLTQPD